MARKKRTSTVLETAQRRLAGLKSIDGDPDHGSTMKRSDFETLITGLSDRLNLYNQHSAQLDQEQNDLDAEEKIVADWSKRWLAATGAKFGTDSNEYRRSAGPARASARKRNRKARAAPAARLRPKLNNRSFANKDDGR